MSLRSRSERKYRRHLVEATTWVQSGRPRLRRKGLAWFSRHHVPAPDYGRKPRRKSAQPVVEQSVTLGGLPIRNAGMCCSCGSTQFDRSTKHRRIEDSTWQVLCCKTCSKVYREKAVSKPTTLMSLTPLHGGERCTLCNGAHFDRSTEHAGIETADWQVITCSGCGGMFRKRTSAQRERRLEPIPPVDDGGGPSWHLRGGGRSSRMDHDW